MSATINQVHKVLSGYRFRYSTEDELQQSIADVLTDHDVVAEREVRLSTSDRIDLLVEGGIGIEVKVAGSNRSVSRQLNRYAEQPQITGLILVSSRPRHLTACRPHRRVPVMFLSLAEAGL